jgi:hypothetical protein
MNLLSLDKASNQIKLIVSLNRSSLQKLTITMERSVGGGIFNEND